MTDWKQDPWKGVFAATLCPFRDDETIDEDGLRAYIAELCAVDGLRGVEAPLYDFDVVQKALVGLEIDPLLLPILRCHIKQVVDIRARVFQDR